MDGKNKKLGLVLAGGGGKGAYQIGVWKALRDADLDQYITSVSGSSVGGLNAALFIQNDLEKAERIWRSISMEKILTPKSESKYTRAALFERDGLEKIIDDDLDMRCFDNSERNCWMTCVRVDGPDNKGEEIRNIDVMDGKAARKYVCGRREYFNLKHVRDDNTRKKILLASSAMPVVYAAEEIEGYLYRDGGARIFHGDNVPVRPLYEVDKCNIIMVVHLTNEDQPVGKEEYPNARLFEIFPKENLGSLVNAGGILDFTPEGAEKRISQGYDDNYILFQQIREIIYSGQNELDLLADAYEKEQQSSLLKKAEQNKSIELLKQFY